MITKFSGPVFAAVICLVLMAGSANAQKWGKVTDEEWNLTPPPQMPEADAVVIFDIGTCEISWDGIIYDQHLRIKIFNKEGAEDAASIEIDYGGNDKIEILKAHTITPEGKKIKVKEFYEKEAGYWRTKTFAFPAVEDGVILEYQLRTVHRRYSFLDPWYFQSELYTLRSEFSLLLYPGFTYNYLGKNLPEAVREPVQEEFYAGRVKVNKYAWKLQDLFPIENEPMRGLRKDYQRSLYYQLVSYRDAHNNIQFAENWAEIGDRLMPPILNFIDGGKVIEKLADSLCAGLETEEEKAERLYMFVRDEIERRGGSTSGYSGFSHENVKQLLEKKYGYVDENNLLLMALLRVAGIEAHPLMIGTRSYSSFSRGVCQLWQFNHLLCYVPAYPNGYALDTGDRSVPYPCLPADDRVAGGVLLKGKESEAIQLTHAERKSGRTVTAVIALRDDGSAVCSTHVSLCGYEMAGYDELRDEPDKRENIKNNILRNRDLDYQVHHASVFCDTVADTMCFDFLLEFPDLAEVVGENLLFAPCVFFPIENTFSAERRQFPIDFKYSVDYKYRIQVTFPPGMKLAEAPEDASFQTQGINYSRMVYPQSDQIAIHSSMSITQPMIRPNHYAAVKEIFDVLVNTGSAMIAVTNDAN